MTDVQIHLALNHFAVAGLFIVVPVFIYGLVRKKQDVLNVSLFLFFILGIISLIVHNSGEGAEEVIEELVDIPHKVIHEHEEMGEKAFLFSMITGFLSILLLVFRWKFEGVKRWAYFLILVVSIVSSVLSGYAGALGGEIRHSEELNAAPVDEEHHDHHEHEDQEED